MTENGNEMDKLTTVMTTLEFAHLGDGELAYIKPLKAGEAERLFPTVKGLPKGIDLFAVVGADGTPLTLTDSRNSAIADVLQNDLEPVSVH